jgi:hypothetical protein
MAGARKPPKQKPAAVRKQKPAAAEPLSAVDVFQDAQPGPQRAIIAALRATVKAAVPRATERIRWGQPVYELGGPFAYLRSARAHVTLGFWRGVELEGQGFRGLAGDGERMRHLTFSSLADLDRRTLTRILTAAAALNRRRGDPTRSSG